jgi:hypothetical protein
LALRSVAVGPAIRVVVDRDVDCALARLAERVVFVPIAVRVVLIDIHGMDNTIEFDASGSKEDGRGEFVKGMPEVDNLTAMIQT